MKTSYNIKCCLLLFPLIIVILLSCSQEQANIEEGPQLRDVEFDYKPNILWLVAEDLSPYIPPFGDSTIQTPNLSRLASEGVRYTNVYSPSGVCAPSRFAISTGVYPTSAGANHMRTTTAGRENLGLINYEALPSAEVKMMSEVLRMNGYYCTNNAKTDYQYTASVTGWDESGMRAHWRNRPEGKPFFSIFNFEITHESQFFGPPMKMHYRFNNSFPDEEITTVWGERIDSSEWILNIPEDRSVPVPPYLPDVEEVRNDIRVMYSNIVEMDRMVGVILDQLEQDGLLDNTIIFWFTDHGGPLPRQKRLMYDSGIKLPMIIRYPNAINAGMTDDQLISFVDFAPTTFSFAGIELPQYLQGQAFDGHYKAEKERKYIFAAADRLDGQYDMIRATKDSRFKYLLNLRPDKGYYLPLEYRERITTMQVLLKMRDEGSLDPIQMQWFRDSKPEEELFDTWNDPHELNNLADDPSYKDNLEELRDACKKWMISTDDKGFIPEPDLIEQLWPNKIQPETATPEINIEGDRITLTSDTPEASIGYQILDPDGSPSTSWIVYNGPFERVSGRKLMVVADRIGYKTSEINTVLL